eukprot:510417-Alexandrium_andersonii.AAC.1
MRGQPADNLCATNGHPGGRTCGQPAGNQQATSGARSATQQRHVGIFNASCSPTIDDQCPDSGRVQGGLGATCSRCAPRARA